MSKKIREQVDIDNLSSTEIRALREIKAQNGNCYDVECIECPFSNDNNLLSIGGCATLAESSKHYTEDSLHKTLYIISKKILKKLKK